MVESPDLGSVTAADDGAEPVDDDTDTGKCTEPRKERAARYRKARLLAPILVLAALFYGWTGTTANVNSSASGDPTKRSDAYNLLTDAFLEGHLGLLEHAPPALTSLENPYDPVQNVSWRGPYHDLALYKGHFYLTWGPTPVVTLLMPWRLLQAGVMPVDVGVIIYCWFGLLFSIALLCFFVKEYLPNTRLWQLALGAFALALCNVAPFLLRRPDNYELAISSGYCFTMLGLYLLASGGLAGNRRPWRLALGSLSIGLALGGRPDLLFAGLFILALFAHIVRQDRLARWADLLRYAIPCFAPFTAILTLLLAYNYVRFGSILENGTTYQLAGFEVAEASLYQVRTLIPNLYYYVVAPLHWTLAFPYIDLPRPTDYPWRLPSDYHGELTGGLLATTPIIFAFIAAIPMLARRELRELRATLFTAVAVGVLTVLFLSIVLPGTTMRYEADYATLFLMVGLVGWFVLTSGRGRRVLAVVGAVAILYGCVVGAAISVTGYGDGLRTTRPGTYWTLNRLTSPLPTALTMVLGHPVITRVLPGAGGTDAIAETEFGLSNYPVEIEIISPRAGQWNLAPTFSRTADAGSRPLSIAVQTDNGDVQFVPVGTGPTGVPLTLHRGLNRILVSAAVDTYASPSPTTLLTVHGLRLTEN